MNKLVAAVGSILDVVFNNFDKIPLVILRTSHFLRTESEKRLLELGLDPEQRSPFWAFFVKSFSFSFFFSKKKHFFSFFFFLFRLHSKEGSIRLVALFFFLRVFNSVVTNPVYYSASAPLPKEVCVFLTPEKNKKNKTTTNKKSIFNRNSKERCGWREA